MLTEPFELTTPSGLIQVTVRPWDEPQRDNAIREIREIVNSLTAAFLGPAPVPLGYLLAFRTGPDKPWRPINMDRLSTYEEAAQLVADARRGGHLEWNMLPVFGPELTVTTPSAATADGENHCSTTQYESVIG